MPSPITSTITQSWQNFTTYSDNEVPCNQFIPLDSWEQCEKRLFDAEWFTLTSSNLTWIASPDRFNEPKTNLTTACDYFIDITDYDSCVKRASYSGTAAKWFQIKSDDANIKNTYTTNSPYYDCWGYQEDRSGANCISRVGDPTKSYFHYKKKSLGSYNIDDVYDTISCAYYYFDECETDNAADAAAALTCKYDKCKLFANLEANY